MLTEPRADEKGGAGGARGVVRLGMNETEESERTVVKTQTIYIRSYGGWGSCYRSDYSDTAACTTYKSIYQTHYPDGLTMEEID